MAAGLPDEIFEELGYFRALDEEEAARSISTTRSTSCSRHHAADRAG